LAATQCAVHTVLVPSLVKKSEGKWSK